MVWHIHHHTNLPDLQHPKPTTAAFKFVHWCPKARLTTYKTVHALRTYAVRCHYCTLSSSLSRPAAVPVPRNFSRLRKICLRACNFIKPCSRLRRRKHLWAVSHSHSSSLFAFLFLLSSLKPFVYLFRRSIRLFHTSIGTYTLTIRTTRPCFLLPTKMLLRPFQRQNFIVKKHHRLDPNRIAPSEVR